MNSMQGLSTSIENQLAQLQYEEKQFELIQRKANMLSKSSFVPDQFKNNISDCALIVEMASRLNTDAFLISRQIYIVHGRPAFATKFVISLLNRSKAITGRLRFEDVGTPGTDSQGMYAYAVDAVSGDELAGPEVTIGMAKKEGWYGKNGSKWPSMPEVMLMYRAASFFVSMYYPEILTGFQTVEEIEDVGEKIVEAEVSRKRGPRESSRVKLVEPEAKTEPADTVVIDGDVIDRKTGEVVEAAKQDDPAPATEPADDMFPAEGSAPFVSLQKKLMDTKTAEDVRILMKSALLTRITAAERTQFNKMCDARIKAFEADMAPNAGEDN